MPTVPSVWISRKKITKARAVEKIDRPSSAAIELADGDSVHGRSMTRLNGMRMAAPHIIEPAAGMIGCSPLKPRPKMAAPA